MRPKTSVSFFFIFSVKKDIGNYSIHCLFYVKSLASFEVSLILYNQHKLMRKQVILDGVSTT